ncbi:hypothetical protein HJG60_007739 [Phyllostomus discolor]|uniref:Uncharacterized protein n=1 Tax=Phyllostomus discolor TaxID=89673 RepID=A0A834EVE9_9CHIR|nr:hypothetical protein HJG60_007739 [Phyllostomus discolor]
MGSLVDPSHEPRAGPERFSLEGRRLGACPDPEGLGLPAPLLGPCAFRARGCHLLSRRAPTPSPQLDEAQGARAPAQGTCRTSAPSRLTQGAGEAPTAPGASRSRTGSQGGPSLGQAGLPRREPRGLWVGRGVLRDINSGREPTLLPLWDRGRSPCPSLWGALNAVRLSE